MPTRAQLARRIDAAQGRILCDTILRNVRYLDVFSCQWRSGDVSVLDGVIVGLDPGLTGLQVIEGKGRFLVPGFIDAHLHVESSLLVPTEFEKLVLPRGTTTAICDPHELANVLGVAGIEYFLKAAETLHLDLWVMLSSCVPATDFETNGAGRLGAEDLVPLLSFPRALGLAEVMNFPGVLAGDPDLLQKLEDFSDAPRDGHCPLLSGPGLSAYIAAGISSCHECTQLEEAREKLSRGLSIWIREGSVAKDLEALIPLLNPATSTSIGFCTDDRNPLDIAAQGHIDHLVRSAIRHGVAPELAYRSAAWSVACHYGLHHKGAIAPGWVADLVLLEDAETCSIAEVFRDGVPVAQLSWKTEPSPVFPNTVRAAVPEVSDLEGPHGRVHVIGIQAGKIITEKLVETSDHPEVASLSVLERHGHGSAPTNGYVRGFGAGFRGAIASSVAHDSHNLLVVGRDPQDMRIALAALIESGGGFVVVRDSQVKAQLELPFGGLMSTRGADHVEEQLRALRDASHGQGCQLPEPFLQLAFLSLAVIPALKLTDRGLVDVDSFKIIDVRADS